MTPPLDALRFDTTHWADVRRGADARGWDNALGDSLLHVVVAGPPGLPALADPTAALTATTVRGFRPARCEVLSVERRTAGGLGVVVQLARLPQEPTGWTYLGAVVVPFEAFTHTIVVQAKEVGFTGSREAIEAMLAHIRPTAPVAAADLDPLMPTHPRARVLTYLDEILVSLAAGPELLAARPWPPADLHTFAGHRLVVGGAALVREAGGHVAARFPLAAVTAVRSRTRVHPLPVALTLALAAAAVAAWTQLDGWLATAGAVVAGLLTLGSVLLWPVAELVVETRAGVFRWHSTDPGWLADGFREVVASHIPAREGEACPPSS